MKQFANKRCGATILSKSKAVFLACVILLFILFLKSEIVDAESAFEAQSINQISKSYPTPLIDVKANPNGLFVPKTFLGVHLNRWKDSTSKIYSDELDYYQVTGVSVTKVGGVATITTPNGHGFYNYRKGVRVRILGIGADGSDFITKVTDGTLGLSTTPGVATLADTPPKLGIFTIQYRPYVPTFGYGAVRSHGSGIQWSTLHLGPDSYNSALMSDWVNRHAGKKLMFTMTGTPEWLATSNISTILRSVSNGVATITHKISPIGLIPIGTGVKVRGCGNAALDGEYHVTASTITSVSFAVKAVNEPPTTDNSTEILIWGNGGGYGYNNPPKDMQELSKFTTWLMTHFGKNIDWIEGQNEANSSYLPNGALKQDQGQASWWMGSLTQLGEMQKRIYQAAKAVKPSVLIGSPALTGLHLGQPIDANPNNKSSSYQLLTANDGAGGKLIDWVDFVPFHIYDIGSTQKFSPKYPFNLYNQIDYVRELIRKSSLSKSKIPIYMNEGGFEHYSGYESSAYKYFNALSLQQQANEIFKQAAIYAGYGVKGFYPWTSGFMGDYETTPEIAAAYDKINTRIAGKTIHPSSGFNKDTGAMFFKTTDGYEEYIP